MKWKGFLNDLTKIALYATIMVASGLIFSNWDRIITYGY